jgi:hypothetical protein
LRGGVEAERGPTRQMQGSAQPLGSFAVRVGRAALELQNAMCAQTGALGQRLLSEALRQAMLA